MTVPRIAADSRASTKVVIHQLDQTPNYPSSTTWLSIYVSPTSYVSTHTVCTGIHQSVQLPTVLALQSSSGSLPKRPLPLPSPRPTTRRLCAVYRQMDRWQFLHSNSPSPGWLHDNPHICYSQAPSTVPLMPAHCGPVPALLELAVVSTFVCKGCRTMCNYSPLLVSLWIPFILYIFFIFSTFYFNLLFITDSGYFSDYVSRNRISKWMTVEIPGPVRTPFLPEGCFSLTVPRKVARCVCVQMCGHGELSQAYSELFSIFFYFFLFPFSSCFVFFSLFFPPSFFK